MSVVKRLTWRTEAPVLEHDSDALDGSARVLEWLEAQHPTPALLPADATQRAEAFDFVAARTDFDGPSPAKA